MSKVFVVNHAGHNYRAAEDFGELRFITRGYVSLGSIDRVLGTVVDEVAQSSPDDYLLLSGMILVNVFAISAWLELHPVVRILNWDDGEYIAYELEKDHLSFLLEHTEDNSGS